MRICEERFMITFIDEHTVKFHGYTVKSCGCIYGKYGRQIKPKPNKRRGTLQLTKYDLCIGLMIEGKRKWWQVHRLVCHLFNSKTGEEYLTMQANHKNRNTLDIHKDNLEWATASENQKHWRENV